MSNGMEIIQADWYDTDEVIIYDNLTENTNKTAKKIGEILDIYAERIREDGTRIYVKNGQMEREKAHKIWALHTGAQIWVYNQNGEVLLQRRSFNPMKSSPGLLDTSAAWHIPIGETIISGGLLEVEQEIGLVASSEELIRIWYYRRETKSGLRYNNEINTVFLLPYEGEFSALRKQDSEVSELKFISLMTLEEDWNNAITLAGYTSKGEQYRRMVILNIKKILWDIF